MLRLAPPERERLFQSPLLKASFGGGEANVAVSLAILGESAAFVSSLPDNPLGAAALAELRKYNVDVSEIRIGSGRLGVYYLETGANQRASSVIYDREGSAISKVGAGSFDWATILKGADWFHFTGITPALSQGAADACMEASKAARAAGARVSIDLNFRKKLWNYGKRAAEVMRPLAALADVLVANEEDVQNCLGIAIEGADPDAGEVPAEAYAALAQKVRSAYPNLSALAITLRQSRSADSNGWSAILSGASGCIHSRVYSIDDIVDRVGGGDAFAAGLIYGFLNMDGDEKASLEFAVAASALKHSFPGDFNLASLAEIRALAAGDASGRVRR
jgi:2-dehydro-3-deoxygluconokinase